MRIVLSLFFLLLCHSIAWAGTYQGKEYPVDKQLLDKLYALSNEASNLQTDIISLNLPEGTGYFIDTINNNLNLVFTLLNLETIHAESGQFNWMVIRNIKAHVSSMSIITKDIPDKCLKYMQRPGVLPAEVIYYGKIKDISIKEQELFQEVADQLAAFK